MKTSRLPRENRKTSHWVLALTPSPQSQSRKQNLLKQNQKLSQEQKRELKGPKNRTGSKRKNKRGAKKGDGRTMVVQLEEIAGCQAKIF